MNTTTGFDVPAYMHHPHLLRPTQLDLTTLTTLTPPALNALTHLWSMEHDTLDRLRDVLVTPAHAESRLTAFLTTWSYEQHWLTQTLHAVLQANSRTPQHPRDTRLGSLRRAWDERVRPTVGAVASNLLGADAVGAHMVAGWLDTAALTLAYRRLGATEPALQELTDKIVHLKARHLDFYAQEATTRLTRSAGARRLARTAVARWRLPGTRYTGPAPARTGAAPLLTDPAGGTAVEEIDRTAAAFPGLTGVRPLRRALGPSGPAGPPPVRGRHGPAPDDPRTPDAPLFRRRFRGPDRG